MDEYTGECRQQHTHTHAWWRRLMMIMIKALGNPSQKDMSQVGEPLEQFLIFHDRPQFPPCCYNSLNSTPHPTLPHSYTLFPGRRHTFGIDVQECPHVPSLSFSVRGFWRSYATHLSTHTHWPRSTGHNIHAHWSSSYFRRSPRSPAMCFAAKHKSISIEPLFISFQTLNSSTCALPFVAQTGNKKVHYYWWFGYGGGIGY